MGSDKSRPVERLGDGAAQWKNRVAALHSSFWRGLEELVIPPVCVMCQDLVESDYGAPHFCRQCLHQIWLPVELACRRCSARLPYKIVGQAKVPMAESERSEVGCQSCDGRQWPFDRAVAVGVYEAALRDHLYELKQPLKIAEAYHSGLLLGHKLQIQLDPARLAGIDFLVPIPIHWRRWFTRKFNQAEQIALGVSKVTGVPVAKTVLKQAAYRKKQGTLSASGRIKNVKASLQVGGGGKCVRGKRILLVDDVMTTGATLTAAAELLMKELKPASIDVAIVARASLV